MTLPRPRFGSKSDREVHAPDVYEILEQHDEAIKELKGFAQENVLDNAKILKEVRDLAATDRHATTKLISALVLTVITTIGGVIGTVAAMRPGQSPPPPMRSALDMKLDVCRPIHEPGSRAECMSRVFEADPK